MSRTSPMQTQIQTKLEQAFDPAELEVINESHLHAGHAGDDGSGESHWRVVISSSAFDGVSRVDRDRMVYAALADEMKMIHALTLKITA